MTHKIQSSLDWSRVETELIHQTVGLMYGVDIVAMIRNIQPIITELSKAEVESRHGKPQKAQQLLIKANNDIEFVEEYILVAALIGKA